MTQKNPLAQYSSLLHSPNNKRKSYSSSRGSKSRSGGGKTEGKKPRTPSPQKPSAARKLDLSPTRKLDLKSPRYFTSPENEEADFNRHGRRRIEPFCSPIKESESSRQQAVDRMIEDRVIGSHHKVTGAQNVWEQRKTQALLDASKIERGILKDILFSETTMKDSPPLSRQGPVFKELLSPARPPIPSPRAGPELKLNDLTIPDNSSEVENTDKISPRDYHLLSSPRPSRDHIERRDMSSSYKEDDFISVCRSREDKSINTSPVRWEMPGEARNSTSPARRSSPRKRHPEDTLDTISDLESRFGERLGSPKKAVSFSEDSGERNLHIHRLEMDVNQRDMELRNLNHVVHGLKQRLGDSETLRIALESEKLRLSLQNITNSPRNYSEQVVHTSDHVTSSQPHVTSAPQNVITSPGEQLQQKTNTTTAVPKPNMGANLSNACNDISEVNSMIHEMKLENDALKAGLKEASIRTQQQTKQLEDRLQLLEKEKDRIAEENRRFQRLIAQDDKGSRIAMLQRDLQNQMTDNEKLKKHLQCLRDNYTKFFGASI